MPRPLGIAGVEELPLWDTVEVLYFLVAGLSAGVVIGFLFPSVWRAFRRRFRNTKRFATALPLETITPAINTLVDTPEETSARQELANFPIESLLVHARSLLQAGKPRDAVQVYLNILSDERVSKGETNRALFELAQTYSFVGLSGRAFDVAFELLSRKPKHRQVFEFLLDLVSKTQRFERILEVLPVWRGDTDAKLRLRISHGLCEHGERLLRSGNIVSARNVVTLATRWSSICARSRIVIWQATSEEALLKMENDVRRHWIAFAADLESLSRILSETSISPMAAANHICAMMQNIAKLPGAHDAYLEIESEFLKTSGIGRSGEKNTARVLECALVYAVLSVPLGWRSESAEALLPILGSIFPQVVVRMASISSGFSEESIQALQVGLRSHRCRSCGAFAEKFAWSCPSCGVLETLVPAAHLLL